MTFYVRNTQTGWYHNGLSAATKYPVKSWPTERGARGQASRLNKLLIGAGSVAQWAAFSKADYDALPVKMVERINLMTKEPYMEAENTPNFMSPSREAYWSA